MKFPIDSYDLKAKYAPGLLLALPILMTGWTGFQKEIKELSSFIGSLLSAAIIYGLSVMVRAMGKREEIKLIKKWGGLPSTIIMSWQDNHIGKALKSQYLEAAKKLLKLPIPDHNLEKNNPAQASAMIDQIFLRIKGIIRKNDKNGLWSIANAEYGFARNLYGSRFIWLILCLIGTACSGFLLFKSYTNFLLIGLSFNIIILTGCIVFGWFILPNYTEQVAFRYAEHAWESFFNISQKQKKGGLNGKS